MIITCHTWKPKNDYACNAHHNSWQSNGYGGQVTCYIAMTRFCTKVDEVGEQELYQNLPDNREPSVVSGDVSVGTSKQNSGLQSLKNPQRVTLFVIK